MKIKQITNNERIIIKIKQIIDKYEEERLERKTIKKIIDNYFGKNFSKVKKINFKENKTVTLNIDNKNKLTRIQKQQYKIERPVERIDELLDLIRIIWNKYPDLRLGQLILNNVNEDKLYDLEDNELYKILKDKYIGNDRSIKL